MKPPAPPPPAAPNATPPADPPPAELAPVKGRDGCPVCRGAGYVIEAEGALSVARLCDCLPVCPRCHGAGRVTVTRGGVPVTGRCRCQQLPDRIEHWHFAQVPARHGQATLHSFFGGTFQHDDPDKRRALLEGVNPWLESFDPARRDNRGLVLHGPVGRGKTHLLVGILRELVFAHGAVVRFVEFSRLLGQLKEGYSRGQGDTQLLGELADVPVLAIDELGKGRVTDWELAIVDEVISRRYNAMRTTLATTNYAPRVATGVRDVNLAMVDDSPQSLGDRVGDRVFSRLREMCSFVEVGGQDMRPLLG